MAKKRGPVALIIIDGWGYSVAREGNAIALAETPFYDELSGKYPSTLLEAHGSRVGLPAGVMGNSEVGHLNIGSGRVIRMDVSLVDHEIETGEFFKNKALNAAMDGAHERGTSLHLMGLISDGQVHSSLTHLYALLKMAKDRGLDQVFVHCFLDGRDTPPSSGAHYVATLQKKIDEIDPLAGINESYQRGVTDEFVEPIAIVRKDGSPVATIKNDDAVIFFNFRPDRARQLTRALMVPGFKEFPVDDRPKVEFVCFTMYDQTFDLPIAFPPRQHKNVLAEVWGDLKVNNYRLAETEKYAHVTYFFNGGVEQEYRCERRLLVPSPKIATYDLAPEMSAFKVTDKVLRGIDEGETDVFVINFANPDMVGHTGKLDKTIEACQYVDTCLGWITKRIREARGTTLITADHGNAEQMIDPVTGSPHTAHTTNPVPFHLIDEDSIGVKLRSGGALEDVAPTLLGLLSLEKPSEMTGRDLRLL
jgi:2,3-bisphosphoglycerate-independent phosphoglycerate mutase